MTDRPDSPTDPGLAAESPNHVPTAAAAANGPSGAGADVPLTRQQKAWLATRVILKRVRFIAVLLAVGMFIGYWDTVKNYWDKWTQPRHVAAHALEPGHEFYCPMDPQVVRSTYEPNGDIPKCPICGMPLSMRQQGETARLPEGVTGRVQISPERIQLAGIKTVAIDFRPVAKQTKTVGYITYDESRLSKVVSRVTGYVEKLYVNKTYLTVQAGAPLAEIYSPELYSTAQELLVAAKSSMANDLVPSARERLRLFGVNDEEIDALVRAGKADACVVIRSPQAGYVIEKKIVAGSRVEAGMTLLEVADLSVVWIEAEVYEQDIGFLRRDQEIEAAVEAFPNRTFSGKVALIYPRVEAATRTNRVRFELDNPEHELRPGMFATVRIDTPLESLEPYKTAAVERGPVHVAGHSSSDTEPRFEFLVVPERAVVDTGSRKVVFVERKPGMFEGVAVELGPRQGDQYPVIQGLRAGDKVAAAGGFLIDAETRLNPAAASTYFGATGGPQSNSRPSTPSAPAQRPADQPPADQDRTAANAAEPVRAAMVEGPSDEDLKNIEQLPEADRKLALAQCVCPVTDAPLGSMGVPIKITLRGQSVFLCCQGCAGKAKREPEATLAKIRSKQ